MRPAASIVSALLCALIITGCGGKPSAYYSAGELIVICDKSDRSLIKPVLEYTFGRTIDTPQPEPLFQITWESATSLKQHTRSPLLLLAATLDGSGPTAAMLRRMVTPEIEMSIRSGDYAVFARRDPWARGQLLLILAAPDQRQLGQSANQWADSLYRWAVSSEMQRLQKSLLRRGEQTSSERRLTEKHSFILHIGHAYTIAEENDSPAFIRLIRHKPNCWLTVAWGPMPDPAKLTPEFIYQQRKVLGNAFSDPVVTYDDRWQWEDATLGELPAIRIRGLWARIEPTGGGPFFSYGLWNPTDRRYYIIDGAVFAPGETKMPHLWQLDALAQTFIPPGSQRKQP